jgi:hypothetical protein
MAMWTFCELLAVAAYNHTQKKHNKHKNAINSITITTI